MDVWKPMREICGGRSSGWYIADVSKNYGCDCGITVCGQYDEDNQFHVDYYFPFFRGTGITTQENVVIERHADKESFAGACDDLRIGVTLIFLSAERC